jgi:16S rRNA processing protein RimM
VLGPFGLKGELKVQSLTDNPERFAPRAKLWLGDQPVTIATARDAGGYVYLTLRGFPDRTAIERFRHAIIQVPEADLPTLPEGEFYRFQLIGVEVMNADGESLGVVQEVLETGANDVYRIRTPEGAELLLPALNDVVLSIDLPAKRMVVDPPAWR